MVQCDRLSGTAFAHRVRLRACCVCQRVHRAATWRRSKAFRLPLECVWIRWNGRLCCGRLGLPGKLFARSGLRSSRLVRCFRVVGRCCDRLVLHRDHHGFPCMVFLRSGLRSSDLLSCFRAADRCCDRLVRHRVHHGFPCTAFPRSGRCSSVLLNCFHAVGHYYGLPRHRHVHRGPWMAGHRCRAHRSSAVQHLLPVHAFPLPQRDRWFSDHCF